MIFRAQGQRFRITKEAMGIGSRQAWVMEVEGRQHIEGIRPWRAARADIATLETLTGLLEQAVRERVRW